MDSTQLLALLVTIYICTSRMALSLPVAVANPDEARDVVLDEDGLQNLLDFCSMHPDFCQKDGRMDKIAEQNFHDEGFKRVESYFLMKLLRQCLDNIKTCDLKKTVIAMESILKVSDNVKDSVTAGVTTDNQGTKRLGMIDVNALRYYLPQYFTDDSINKAAFMFARHGRKFNKWLEGKAGVSTARVLRARRSAGGRTATRNKRSLMQTMFNGMVRQACNSTSDCKNSPQRVPNGGTSSI